MLPQENSDFQLVISFTVFIVHHNVYIRIPSFLSMSPRQNSTIKCHDRTKEEHFHIFKVTSTNLPLNIIIPLL